MPRAVLTPGRLYDQEIGALQRVLRFSQQDGRFTKYKRERVRACVDELTIILSNAQSRPTVNVKG